MKITSLARLEAIFNKFCYSIGGDVPGVVRIEGKKKGPTLGITAMTHGNEPSGLAIFDYLLGREIDIQNNLLCGTLYLVVNNIEATELYFKAEKMSAANRTLAEEKRDAIKKSRYLDVNMNRLPSDIATRDDDDRYEVLRARELSPVWREFDFGLDVHSTTAKSEPMMIVRGDDFNAKLVRGFPIKDVLTRIVEVQIGAPPIWYYGLRSKSTAFAIEAGQHTDPKSFTLARDCSISLLQNLGMLRGKPRCKPITYNEYRIQSSIRFRDNHFDFVRDFGHKYLAYEGDVLAENQITGERIRAPFDCHLLMPSNNRKEKKDITEEMAFISEPVREFQI